jgi:hypothetical protein
MGEIRIAYTYMVGNLKGKKGLGERRRIEDDIQMNLNK